MKKVNLVKILYTLYSFLFIFTMINREFLFFGIDLRYILLILGVMLTIYGIINYKRNTNSNKRVSDKIYNAFFILFLWCLFSNISWTWNNLELYKVQTLNQNILIINNLIALIVYKMYKKYFDEKKIQRYIIFSCCILVVSFILTGMGYSLSEISGSDVRSMSYSTTLIEHKNIFGGNFRISGYAEDANYASLFLVIGFISLLQTNAKKINKFILGLIFAIAFGYSCSKTILASFVLGIIYLSVLSFSKRIDYKQSVSFIFIISLVLGVIILPNLGFLSSFTTMTTRFKMWNIAKNLFTSSPIIGSGLNSFKSYISAMYYKNWYVQAHSTYWQLLSETGLIGLSIFIILMIRCLNNKKLTNLNKYLIFIFFIFAINFESIQLQVTVYILYILSLYNNDSKIKKDREDYYEK